MADVTRYPIVPWPRSLDPRDGAFTPHAPIEVTTGPNGPVVSGDDRVLLAIRPDAPAGTEAYRLDARPERIEITARDPRGLFYGAQTLRQLASASPHAIPAVHIEDAPRFRGAACTWTSGGTSSRSSSSRSTSTRWRRSS